MTVSTAMSAAMSANMAMDVQGRTINSLCAKRRGSHVRARPRPLEIEPADPAVDIQYLADERQAVTDARSHRGGIDLVERDAAGRHFGVVVAAIAGDVERPLHERVRQPAPILARQVRQRRRTVDAGAG